MTESSSEEFELDPVALEQSRYFGEILTQRLSRREWLKGALLAGVALPLVAKAGSGSTLRFTPIPGSTADQVIVPPGYKSQVLIRWGDSLQPGVPDMDTRSIAAGGLLTPQAAQHQAAQFGAHCDAIQFFGLDQTTNKRQARTSRGVLCVNNEYIDHNLAFPGKPPAFGGNAERAREYVAKYPAMVAFSQATHGISIVEVVRERRQWRYLRESRFNRRLTANTPFEIRGPARGTAWMRTTQDPEGVRAFGTFGNCAGGRTPWGTYLSAEENIQDYFGGFRALSQQSVIDRRVIEAHRRWRMWPQLSPYGWDAQDARFDLTREPHEPFRCGWIVEVNPLDPSSTPIKRTALGRFAHEAASPFVAASGQVAVYMGDDDKFEYVYKFVSDGRFDLRNPAANAQLLDEGTLYVARFSADGSGEWLPLVYDPNGPLNESTGFRNQAEVLIKARAAGDVLGATTMDRPEDVEPNPLTGHVYIVCTRNESRTGESGMGRYGERQLDTGPNAANPRGANEWGHIIELREDDGDHTGRRFHWDLFLMAGDPARALLTQPDQLQAGLASSATWYAGQRDSKALSPIGSPDNIGFDTAGNLWMVTDGNQPNKTNNGCFVCATQGPHRGELKQFMSGPVGAEVCGCTFTPDNETLFLSIQHPGEGGSMERPISSWPDGNGKEGPRPPRSSVIAISKVAGGQIGS